MLKPQPSRPSQPTHRSKGLVETSGTLLLTSSTFPPLPKKPQPRNKGINLVLVAVPDAGIVVVEIVHYARTHTVQVRHHQHGRIHHAHPTASASSCWTHTAAAEGHAYVDGVGLLGEGISASAEGEAHEAWAAHAA